LDIRAPRTTAPAPLVVTSKKHHPTTITARQRSSQTPVLRGHAHARKAGPRKAATATARSRVPPNIIVSTQPDFQGSVVVSSFGPHSGIVKLDAGALCDLDKGMAFPSYVPPATSVQISEPTTPPLSFQSKSTTLLRPSPPASASTPINMSIKKIRPAKLTRTTIANAKKRMALLAAAETSMAAAKAAVANAVSAKQREAEHTTSSAPKVAAIPMRRTALAAIPSELSTDPIETYSVISAALRARIANMFQVDGAHGESAASTSTGMRGDSDGVSRNTVSADSLPATKTAVEAVAAAAQAYKSHLRNHGTANDVLVAVSPRTGEAKTFSRDPQDVDDDAGQTSFDGTQGSDAGHSELEQAEREWPLEMFLNA
jgi:hypothetical protein